VTSIDENKMEGNKDESERCISLAIQYSKQGDDEKALKFLNKAERLYPTQKAKGMIHFHITYISIIH
jgi:Tfp pilus assembly protein PilF